MTTKALDPIVPFWWSPDSEAPDEQATKFRLRALTGLQRLEINDCVKITDVGLVTTAAGMRVILRHGLLDWKGFRDSAGEVSYSDNMDVNIARLPMDLILQLCTRIVEASRVSSDAKKD